MKTPILLSLAFLATVPVQAQSFRPVVGGAALGAVIGHNSGSLRHNAWRGAAYGAGAGLIIGGSHQRAHHRDRWQHASRSSGYHYGYRYSPYYYPPAYYAPVVVGSGYYGSGYSAPNYGGTGALLGGIAGAIIGHNDGRHGWEGAAYGAGLGYILGRVFEHNTAVARPVRVVRQPAVAETAAAPAASPTPGQVTIINNYYGATSTPMTSANGLFGR